MPFTHGINTDLYWGGFDVTGFFKSAGIDMNRDTAETTAFGSTSKTYIGGLVDGTISAEGMYDSTAVNGEDVALQAALAAATADISMWPEGDVLGNFGFAMRALQTKYAITSSTDDVNQVSAEAQSSSGAERVASLRALASAAAGSVNGTGVDGGASSLARYVGYLHVTAITAGNIVVAIQDSPDNVTFTDRIVFAAMTAIGTQRITAAGPLARYTRVRHVVTTGPATYHASVGRTALTA